MKAPARTMAPVNSLSIREASEKYGIPKSTLSRWVNEGMVRVVQHAGTRGQPTLISEPDVAQLAPHYKPGRGRRERSILEEALAAS